MRLHAFGVKICSQQTGSKWAFAMRFVKESSGRLTDLAEIGRANVTGEWI
jgi:hypothetical protein